MIRIIIVIFCTWLLQVHVLAAASSSLNCSQYANDIEVLQTLPFYVPVNPKNSDINQTYALGYNGDTIFSLNIANENFIPPTIFCLSSLKLLFVQNSNFCGNQSTICQLSPEIGRLGSSLEIMSIISTKITHLPTSFGKLQNLKQLRLENTSLMALPNSFGSLKLLSSLTITSSQLRSLPKTIGLLSSLKHISLNNNIKLRSIDSLIGLVNLTRLSAINCSIVRIPRHLPNINYVDMSNNQLTNLIGIETLGSKSKSSKSFFFGMNRIRSLPSQISSVQKLAVLVLPNNQLTNLPSTIFGSQSLALLDIQRNLFTSARLESIVSKFKGTNGSMRLLYETNTTI